MKKITLSVFTFFLLLCTNTTQALTRDELQQRFAQQEVVRAQFTQQRHISGMAQPLNSSGQMLMSRTLGLWWQQQKPFVMTMVLDDERMVQTIGSQAPQVMTAENSPQLFQFNALLQAVFKADQRVLEQNFFIVFTDLGKNQWQLLLTPRVSPLDKIFETITLQGDAYVERIVVKDKQGDRTEIIFVTDVSSATALTIEEKHYFVP